MDEKKEDGKTRPRDRRRSSGGDARCGRGLICQTRASLQAVEMVQGWDSPVATTEAERAAGEGEQVVCVLSVLSPISVLCRLARS